MIKHNILSPNCTEDRNGLDYPHRPASSVWCLKSSIEPTEDDYEKRFK